ncbi:MAG: hypothetical protein ACR2O4_00765, partial [Hyphomicrobiaceae bacterium]
ATKKVNMLADRDVIQMSRSDGRFNALRFEATRGSINIYRIRVFFGNGDKQDLDVNQKIREGERTDAIDLDGRSRVIDRIEMLYASSKLLQTASIDVFGRHGKRGGRIEREVAQNDDNGLRPTVRDLKSWKKLGQRYVDFDFDRDRIWVGLDEGRFDQILLRAKGGDIRLLDLKVVYGNRKADDIRVRRILRDGKQTRGISLRGRHRGIRRIELVYEKARNRRRPVLLEVYARPSSARPADPVDEAGGWQVLGSREVDLSLDRDVIRVDRGEGPFDAISLRARGSTITIYDIRVTFGNGKRQTFRIDKLLRRGTQSPAIDLKGRARGIRKVELLYKKTRNNRARANIQLLGRKVERRRKDDDEVAEADPLPRGWALLGRSELERRSEKGTVEAGNRRERYREIMFRVKGGPVKIKTATVRFRNGSTMRLRMRGTLRPGDRTNAIDLKGRRRQIDAIDLDYDRIRGRRVATVEVLGKR